ncbi:hypothetical protein ACFQ7W_35215 [Streptomyces niveus]|uniref:hypothetical protein n=1 Tax=Streptomyces niveus TaxID=193462 RepID=UPI0036837A2D
MVKHTAQDDPGLAKEYLAEIEGDRSHGVSYLVQGIAATDLTAALDIVEDITDTVKRANALGKVVSVRVSVGDLVGAAQTMEQAEQTTLRHARELVDTQRVQAERAAEQGKDRLARVLRDQADKIMEAVSREPSGNHFILPFLSPVYVQWARVELDRASGAVAPTPLPETAAVRERARAARTKEMPRQRAAELVDLADECLGPWREWTAGLDHPGTSAWPEDAVHTVSSAPPPLSEPSAAAPGSVLWHGALPKPVEGLRPAGDFVAWTCGDRVGVLDAGTGPHGGRPSVMPASSPTRSRPRTRSAVWA